MATTIPLELKETLRPSERVLRLVGLGIPTGRDWFYNVSFAVLAVCVLGELIYFVNALSSFENFLEATALAPCIGFCILGLAKMQTVRSQRPVVTRLIGELGALWPQGALPPGVRDIKAFHLRRLSLVINSFILLYTVLIWLFNLFPLMEMAGGADPSLPYFVWYPFDALNPTIYPFIYLTQIWDGLISACGIVGPDCLLVVSTSHLCMMFRVLQHDVRALAARGHAHAELAGLVFRHRTLLRLAEDLEQIYSLVILINFTCGSIIICLVGFQATAISSKELAKFGLFLIASLAQVLVICAYGDMLIRASGGVADAAYESNWMDMHLSIRKSLLLLLHRAQKPSFITAYKFSIVSMHSFTSILSTSWSYFTLLRTMYDPSNGLRARAAQ